MCHHQIKTIAEDIAHIALVMGARALSGQQITTDGIVTAPDKSIPDSARVFASD
jgi:hypothetical protein